MAGRSPLMGLLVAAGSVALTTVLLYPLSEVAPAVSASCTCSRSCSFPRCSGWRWGS